jgi:SAM-dependent methyltransferase
MIFLTKWSGLKKQSGRRQASMSSPGEYSFSRYLKAKKSVDDRALNRPVLERLVKALREIPDGKTLQVLEVGAGIGTMLERLTAWGVLKDARYEAIDLSPDHLSEARRLLPVWSRAQGFKLTERRDGDLCIERKAARLSVRFEAIDLYEFIAREQGKRRWDLLLAHAFMDLMDVSRVLPGLISLLNPGGLLYLTMNFDGVTILEPSIDLAYDEHVLALYNDSMDQRFVDGRLSGDSRVGRHLFARLREHPVQILGAGSADWVVYPGIGGYPCYEAYFLHFIIHLIGAALQDHPALEPARFNRWITARHDQIEQAGLFYIAHQLDYLGRRDDPRSRSISEGESCFASKAEAGPYIAFSSV